jgi:hypothetical protein
MSTKAQIKANQQNAQKSTGPQTDEGKAAVSLNAVKHGLFAAEAVISGENPADYELYRDEYLAELLPVGMLESMLAERIISLAWRLQRAERMQNEAIDVLIAKIETDPWQQTRRERAAKAQDPRAGGLKLLLGWATKDDFSNSRVLDRLMLYERRIENSLYKTINRLKQYQVIRQIKLDETTKPSPSVTEEAAGHSQSAYTLSDLKKQSQFAAAHLGAKPLMKGDYNNNPAGGDEENKPKQSQFHTPALAEGVGTREKSVTAATG